MLEVFTILTEGGVVLWSKQISGLEIKGNPINMLIRDVLLQVGLKSR